MHGNQPMLRSKRSDIDLFGHMVSQGRRIADKSLQIGGLAHRCAGARARKAGRRQAFSSCRGAIARPILGINRFIVRIDGFGDRGGGRADIVRDPVRLFGFAI